MRSEKEIRGLLAFLESKTMEWKESSSAFMVLCVDGYRLYSEEYERVDSYAWIEALRWVLGEEKNDCSCGCRRWCEEDW